MSDHQEVKKLMETVYVRLTRLERQVVDRYLAGDFYKEIAASVGVTKRSVNNTVQRVKRKLRAAIA